MNKSNNAIIITWIGNNPTDDIITAIADVLVNNRIAIPEMITITTKDENGVANALLRDVDSKNDSTSNINDARTAAIILIGKRFEDTLTGTSGDYIPFTMALLHGIAEAKKKHTEEGVALINAITIIAEMDRIPKIARMYHITNEVIRIIRQVYKNTWIS